MTVATVYLGSSPSISTDSDGVTSESYVGAITDVSVHVIIHLLYR